MKVGTFFFVSVKHRNTDLTYRVCLKSLTKRDMELQVMTKSRVMTMFNDLPNLRNHGLMKRMPAWKFIDQLRYRSLQEQIVKEIEKVIL